MLSLLLDTSETLDVRLGVLDALNAARFSDPNFDACRAKYIAALRKLAEDSDPSLRERALGVLARDQDGLAQKLLIAGLKNPDQALVPVEKALQLLKYDIHSDAYPLARKIVAQPPNALAKQEALRLLSADPDSVPLLEKILRDKHEPVEARQICAAALNANNPTQYLAQARELVIDSDENPDIQSMSLTALTYFGGKQLAADKALYERVEAMSKHSPNKTKAVAKQFLEKYR